MTSAPSLSVQGLSCGYGDSLTLDRVSMTLETGEILGVTGPPGAGISTLIKAIMLLVAPREGRVLIRGKPHELASSRALVAYLPEELRPPGHLTGRDLIKMARTVQSNEGDGGDVEAMARDLELDPALLSYPIRRYAREDVQKLGLTALLSTNRPILLLDRPMAELEPAARAGLRHRLRQHAAEGGAILIGSHHIEDHQDAADRLAILKDGRLTEAEPVALFKETAA